MLLKNLSPIKLKQLSLIFISNQINNLFGQEKIYMTLIVHKYLETLFQLLITLARILITALFFVI